MLSCLQVTPERIAFMVNYTSGLICIPMPKARLDELELPLMVESRENEEAMKTAFTITVDARHGVSTGISAEDRALTIKLLADPSSAAADFSKPGHIFPLVYASETRSSMQQCLHVYGRDMQSSSCKVTLPGNCIVSLRSS